MKYSVAVSVACTINVVHGAPCNQFVATTMTSTDQACLVKAETWLSQTPIWIELHCDEQYPEPTTLRNLVIEPNGSFRSRTPHCFHDITEPVCPNSLANL